MVLPLCRHRVRRRRALRLDEPPGAAKAKGAPGARPVRSNSRDARCRGPRSGARPAGRGEVQKGRACAPSGRLPAPGNPYKHPTHGKRNHRRGRHTPHHQGTIPPATSQAAARAPSPLSPAAKQTHPKHRIGRVTRTLYAASSSVLSSRSLTSGINKAENNPIQE